MKLDRKDRLGPTSPPDNRFLLIGTLTVIAVAALALFALPELRDYARRGAYSLASLAGARENRFAGLYKRWNMEPLSAGLEASDKISPNLDKLSREPCDKKAVYALGGALAAEGERRAAANVYLGFAAACANGEGEQYRAAGILEELGDHESVVAVVDALIMKHPGVANYHYLRGRARAALKRYDDALADYKSALELMDPRNVRDAVFVEMANIYVALGRPCDGAAAIVAWIALAPASRNTPQARKVVQEYAARGCRLDAPVDLNRL
jgi:tetratricopeptide (TPR) repeat protein